MKARVATILVGIVLAVGIVSPSWAQGSEEHSDNGGGHPGVSIGPYDPIHHYDGYTYWNPYPYWDGYPYGYARTPEGRR